MKLSCKFSLLEYKGALLIAFITTLITFHGYYTESMLTSYLKLGNNFIPLKDCTFSFYARNITQLLAPLFGLLTDIFIGRYTLFLVSIASETIVYALWIIILLVSNNIALMVLQYSTMVVEYFLTAACLVYALPLLTDQMIDASGDELSASVDLYFWGINLAYLVCMAIEYLLNNYQITRIISLYSYVDLSVIGIAISALIICRQWLVIHKQIQNPITEIFKVLNYARKNKHPKGRSALTYWEQEAPSRINLAKRKYGGPYTEENVEDTKTVLSLIPLIVVIHLLSLLSGNIIRKNGLADHPIRVTRKSEEPLSVFLQDDVLGSALVVICLPVFYFIINPLYPNLSFRLTMLKKISLGIFVHFVGVSATFITEIVGQKLAANSVCMYNDSAPVAETSLHIYWYILPNLLNQAGLFFACLAMLKFLIAQSPHHIKGLLFGLNYCVNGINHALGGLILMMLSHYASNGEFKCGYYYHLMYTLLILIVLVMFVVLAKRYKLRKRNDPINVHLIVGNHVEKDIMQREALLSESSEINDTSPTIGIPWN